MNYESAKAGNPVRESQVPQMLNRLDSAIEDAEKALSSLETRVQPVSRGNPPTTGTDTPKVAEVLCPVADRIRLAAARVTALSEHATNIMSRVEL